jgi:hypothetical protein
VALKELRDFGFIQYQPSTGGVRPNLIRIYPHNAKTGVRVLQVDERWVPGFILGVTPITKLFDVEVTDRVTTPKPLADKKPMAGMKLTIADAIVTIVHTGNRDGFPATGQETLLLNRYGFTDNVKGYEFIVKMKDVAGLDYIYRRECGLEPLLINQRGKAIPKDGEVLQEKPVEWRGDGSTVDGIEIKIVHDPKRIPQDNELGVSSSWEVAGDRVETDLDFSPPQISGTSDTTAPGTAGDATGPEIPPRISVSACPQPYPQRPLGTTSLKIKEVVPGASADVATPAPPPSAPPSASAQFVRAQSERQLRQRQLESLYALRGARVTHQQRMLMSSAEVSCIETYERLSGVPFCLGDMPFLNQALTNTSHEKVLRAIRKSSGWPNEDPGEVIFLNGMKHVWNLIISNKYLRGSAKKTRVGKAGRVDKDKKQPIPFGSAKSAKVDAAMKAEREARKQKAREILKAQAMAVSLPTEPVKEQTT